MSEGIVLHDITKFFPGSNQAAVSNLSLEIEPGEIVALLGPSGCGKTTTLRLIAGFERPDTGTIKIAESTVAADSTFVAPERRGVGMIFQEYALFPHLTVARNIMFGLHSIPRRERRPRLEELLELTGLTQFQDRYPYQLSGGQQQRVAMARALAPRPHVLLLDEPFSNLDTELRLQMRVEVRDLIKQLGTTAILVTHDQQEAMTVADRMAVMLDGTVHQVDTPESVYHYPANRAVARFVGQGTFVPARITGDLAESDLGRFEIHEHGPQDQVDLLIRPRDVSIEVDPEGVAIVSQRTFHGPETTYLIQLPCGVQLQSSQPSYVSITPGTRVNVRCNRARLAAYGEDARVALTRPMSVADMRIGSSIDVSSNNLSATGSD